MENPVTLSMIYANHFQTSQYRYSVSIGEINGIYVFDVEMFYDLKCLAIKNVGADLFIRNLDGENLNLTFVEQGCALKLSIFFNLKKSICFSKLF